MPVLTMRRGKAAELRVMAELTRHGLDVYAPLIDDQGIDLIVRAKDEHLKVRYWEIQVKSVEGYGRVMGLRHESISAFAGNYILIINYHFNERDEYLYLLQKQALKLVPPDAPSTNLCLSKSERSYYYEKKNQTLDNLADRMSSPKFSYYIAHPPGYKGMKPKAIQC